MNGNLVFETTDYPNNPFKGEKSTNDKLPDGTYWYMIHVTSPFVKTYTGALTLLHGRFN
jgi:hypothetical protein